MILLGFLFRFIPTASGPVGHGLRSQAKNLSDEQIIERVAQAQGRQLADVAGELAPSDKGMWGNRWSASIDNYQAGLQDAGRGLASAVGMNGVADTLDRWRQDNRTSADIATSRSQQQGAVDNWRDINGVGALGNYVGGLAVGSAPYLGEAVIGGLAGRAAALGARGLTAADAAVNAATAARVTNTARAGATVGGAAASYPSSVGDVMGSMREQTGGAPDDGAAFALGAPYAALNAFGAEALVARTVGARARQAMGMEVLAAAPGMMGAAKRAGGAVLNAGAAEAVNETAQEGVNQLGRMAVDPSETFLNERSAERFVDSAVGGFALGGALGGMAGRHRSAEALRTRTNSDGTMDLLADPVAPQEPPAPPAAPEPMLADQDTAEMAPPAAPEPMLAPEPMPPAPVPVPEPQPPIAPEPTPPSPDELQAQAIQQSAERHAQNVQRMESLGVTNRRAQGAFAELERWRDSGVITPEQFTEHAGLLVGAKPIDVPAVNRLLIDLRKTTQGKADADAAFQRQREAETRDITASLEQEAGARAPEPQVQPAEVSLPGPAAGVGEPAGRSQPQAQPGQGALPGETVQRPADAAAPATAGRESAQQAQGEDTAGGLMARASTAEEREAAGMVGTAPTAADRASAVMAKAAKAAATNGRGKADPLGAWLLENVGMLAFAERSGKAYQEIALRPLAAQAHVAGVTTRVVSPETIRTRLRVMRERVQQAVKDDPRGMASLEDFAHMDAREAAREAALVAQLRAASPDAVRQGKLNTDPEAIMLDGGAKYDMPADMQDESVDAGAADTTGGQVSEADAENDADGLTDDPDADGGLIQGDYVVVDDDGDVAVADYGGDIGVNIRSSAGSQIRVSAGLSPAAKAAAEKYAKTVLERRGTTMEQAKARWQALEAEARRNDPGAMIVPWDRKSAPPKWKGPVVQDRPLTAAEFVDRGHDQSVESFEAFNRMLTEGAESPGEIELYSRKKAAGDLRILDQNSDGGGDGRASEGARRQGSSAGSETPRGAQRGPTANGGAQGRPGQLGGAGAGAHRAENESVHRGQISSTPPDLLAKGYTAAGQVTDPHLRSALDGIRSAGIGRLVDQMVWKADRAKGAGNGAIKFDAQLGFWVADIGTKGAARSPLDVRITVAHEVGHVVDRMQEGKFSGTKPWEVYLNGDTLVPVGAAAREMHLLSLDPDSPLEEMLGYPMRPSEFSQEELPRDRISIQREIFAQAFGAYLAHPKLAEYMREVAPQTSLILDRIIAREADGQAPLARGSGAGSKRQVALVIRRAQQRGSVLETLKGCAKGA